MKSLVDLDEAIERLDGVKGDRATAADQIIGELSHGGATRGSLDSDVCVAGLLRICAVDADLLYDSTHRRPALDLILERLAETGSSILRQYSIDHRTQADEACRRLSRAAPDAKSALDSVLQSYAGIDSLAGFRQRLLQALNQDLIKGVIRPFIDLNGDATEVLRACLGAALAYCEANAGAASTALEEALAGISAVTDRLRLPATVSSKALLPVFEQLSSDLRSHFEGSPFSKPAQLTIDADLRRHPLHVPDLELSIPVEVRNEGEGVAIDVELELSEAIGITPVGPPLRLSDVPPGSIVVELRARTDPGSMTGTDGAMCELKLSWVNADASVAESTTTAELIAQDSTINWEALLLNNPYSLEAVTREDELVGRSQMLERIAGTLTTTSVGSAYVHGQKRVGKTSLARVALRLMEERFETTCIYRDIGSINNPDPALAINNLTDRLRAELDKRIGLPQQVRDIRPDGSLAPLIHVLEEVSAAGARVVIALDEFDRLPAPLFRRTAEQDAFFTGLRSISTIDGIGLLLIGGERMKLIINGPGVELNKFAGFPVDYLDRSTQWSDFEELVRKPTEGRLEFTEAACTSVYDCTAGNPYYSKLLCGQVLELAARRRDAYVDTREIDSATELLLRTIDPTSFSHYWEDFLLEQNERRDEITLNRRRCLLALGLAWSSRLAAPADDVVDSAAGIGLDGSSTQRELQELVNRGIIASRNGVLTPRVNLFGRWIADRGQNQIVLTATELEAAQRAIAERESLRITMAEAEEVADRFGVYRGRSLTGERILDYLRQFGGHREQQLVFQLLKSIQFIGPVEEQRLLRDAYEMLQQSLKAIHGQWNRKQIALTYVGPIGKSGLAMARSFVQANSSSFRREDIHPPEQLPELASQGVTDIVIIDDFVGSGASLSRDLRELSDRTPTSVAVHVFVLAGMSAGLDAVSRAVTKAMGDRAAVHCLSEIHSEPGIFDPRAGVYPDVSDAADARAIVEQVGRRLEPRAPLGYGDCCAPIAFSRTIPNSAPAILWSASKGAYEFEPLFPRN